MTVQITGRTWGPISEEWTLREDGLWLADVELRAPHHQRQEIAAALQPILRAVVQHAGDLDATIAALVNLRGATPLATSAEGDTIGWMRLKHGGRLVPAPFDFSEDD